jgi:hypothetical protein
MSGGFLPAGLFLLLAGAMAFTCNGQQEGPDHQNMMDQLGVKTLRRGPDPNNQSTFDEATANPFKDSMPDVLTMKNGTKVTRADQWPLGALRLWRILRGKCTDEFPRTRRK